MAKIAIICDRELLAPFDQRVWKGAKSFKNEGHTIDVITPHSKNANIIKEGINICCIKKVRFPGITAIKILHKALKGNYDLFYCHEFDPLIYSFFLNLLQRKRIIWDCHEHYPSLLSTRIKRNGDIEKRPVIEKIIDKTINLCLRNITAITSVSAPLVNYYSSKKPTFTVPNFPNKFLFNPSKENKRIKDLYAGKKVIVYQGGIKPGRGLRSLLAAMKIVINKNPNALFVIVGGEIKNSEWDKQTYQFLKDYKENFLTTGWVKHSELAPYLVHADVGIIMFRPTHYNNIIGLPNKLFEYLACGLPVISSNLPQIRMIIKHTKTGILVESDNPENIAKSILKIIVENNNKKYKTRCLKIANKFVWEVTERKLLKLVEKLTVTNL